MSLDLVDSAITAYAIDHSSPESPLLTQVRTYTEAHVPMPQMLSGTLQGRILSMIARTLRPNCIVEIGTYTGYAALCLAEGLPPAGKLITIDNDPKMMEIAQGFFQQSPYAQQIIPHVGDAQQVIPTLSSPVDLVFLDADKEHYTRYYELILPLLPPGGQLIADNVLWSGKILEEHTHDPETLALQAFNGYVEADTRVEQVL